MANLNHVLTTTRSVRLRLDFDRQVSPEVIGECLQLALQAPTGGHAQDWRWVVIGDPQLKAELGRLYLAGYEEYVLKPLQSAEGTDGQIVRGRLGGVGPDGRPDARTAKILRGADHLARNIGRAPYLVIPSATRPDPERGGAGTNSGLYGSLFPAIWQFNLALRARGLGTCLTSLHLHHAAEAAALLEMPDEAVQMTLLPVAYTIGTGFRPAARRAVREVSFLDRWGAAFPYDDKPFDQLEAKEVL
ncbi:MAG: nitroreductase family protein [Nocardioidaceae bacterium]